MTGRGADDERAQLDDVLRRLARLLPSRIGPRAAADVMRTVVMLKEQGLPPSTVLQAAQAQLDAFAQRPALSPPWPLGLSRAIATVAPKKLAMWSFVGRTPRFLPDALVAGVADHADALIPAFGDVDFALGVAWHNVLTFHCALVAGECWSRNDAQPVIDVAAVIDDARLGDDDVPMMLVRGRGLFIARGQTPPAEATPFSCREVWLHLWGHGRTHVSTVGDGSFEGVRRALRLLRLPLDTAHLPALLAIASLPLPNATLVVDVDGVIEPLAGEEDRLEQDRLRHGASTRQRLGVTTMPAATVRSIRLSADGTTITLRDDFDVDVS